MPAPPAGATTPRAMKIAMSPRWTFGAVQNTSGAAAGRDVQRGKIVDGRARLVGRRDVREERDSVRERARVRRGSDRPPVRQGASAARDRARDEDRHVDARHLVGQTERRRRASERHAVVEQRLDLPVERLRARNVGEAVPDVERPLHRRIVRRGRLDEGDVPVRGRARRRRRHGQGEAVRHAGAALRRPGSDGAVSRGRVGERIASRRPVR